MERTRTHFSKIARVYKDVRTTDLDPILLIQRRLQELKGVEVADVGCGVGRYDRELFRYFKEKLCLTCIDENQEMLNELARNLRRRKIRNLKAIRASAAALPLSANSLDAVVTFNAIQHFRFMDFLNETARVLRDNGYLFIYTRLRSQNRRNIWGRFFPEFHQKETRLYELNELKELLEQVPYLRLESTEYFKHRRKAKLEWLITQAACRHYSTFELYEEKEFEQALEKFRKDMTHHFNDPDNIIWDDENIMLVIKKEVG